MRLFMRDKPLGDRDIYLFVSFSRRQIHIAVCLLSLPLGDRDRELFINTSKQLNAIERQAALNEEETALCETVQHLFVKELSVSAS